MKRISVGYLLCLFLFAAASQARAQSATKCFRADWLQGARVVNLKIDGNKVAGTFTVEGDGGAPNAGRYEFSGTLRGNTLTVAFAGGRLPDVTPSEMKSLVWTLARDGGRELLRIKFRGKNYETNEYEDRLADFEPCGEAAHESPPATAGSGGRGEDPILSVRERYAAINRGSAKYRKVTKELSGFSTEGGELVAYFDGPSIVKLTANHLGETGRALEEFYYRDGKLIFVFRRLDTYDAPLSGRVSKTVEDRFYFRDDRLIRWVDARSRPVAPGGDEYLETQALYLNNSRRFIEGARSPKPVIEAPEPDR